MTLLTRNQSVLSDQRKVGPPVRVRLKQRLPTLVVVAPFTLEAELARVAIAMAGGTGVRHRNVETPRMTAAARNRFVRPPQWKPSRVVIETNLLPATHLVTCRASGDVVPTST